MSGFIFRAWTADGKCRMYTIDSRPLRFEYMGDVFVPMFERDYKQRKPSCCKSVVMDGEKVFPSIKTAADYIAEEQGKNARNARVYISKAANGYYKQAYGHTWRFE